MTWTMSNGQTKKMQLSLVVSGETFKTSLSLFSLHLDFFMSGETFKTSLSLSSTCTSAIWCYDILLIFHREHSDTESERPLLYSASLGTVLPQQWFFVVVALPKSEKVTFIRPSTFTAVVENTFTIVRDTLQCIGDIYMRKWFAVTANILATVTFVKTIFFWKMRSRLGKAAKSPCWRDNLQKAIIDLELFFFF